MMRMIAVLGRWCRSFFWPFFLMVLAAGLVAVAMLAMANHDSMRFSSRNYGSLELVTVVDQEK